VISSSYLLNLSLSRDTSTEPVIIEEKISKKNGEVNIRKYARGKVLGKGGFATAYEFTDLEENKLFAAKIVAKSSLTKKRALEKVHFLPLSRLPSISRIFTFH